MIQEAIRQYNIINSKNRKRANDICEDECASCLEQGKQHLCPRCGDEYQGLHLFCGSPSVEEVLKCRLS